MGLTGLSLLEVKMGRFSPELARLADPPSRERWAEDSCLCGGFHSSGVRRQKLIKEPYPLRPSARGFAFYRTPSRGRGFLDPEPRYIQRGQKDQREHGRHHQTAHDRKGHRAPEYCRRDGDQA